MNRMNPKKELIILKLGGSVITRKSEDKAEVHGENLKRLAGEIAKAKEKRNFSLVIVHGAGPFGHVPAKRYGLDKGIKDERQLKGFALTHQSMEKLNYFVVDELGKAGVNAVAYQPSAVGILKNSKLIYFPTIVMEELISLDVVPVAYGDVLVDEETGVNILSGDHLVPYLAEALNAERVVMAADVPGIFDSDPKINKDAKLIKEINPGNIGRIKEIGSSQGTDVTGGMERKLSELLRLAESGIESEIINAIKPGLLKKALLGEKGLGTIIKTNP
ncbi:MAG: isopentenyl phosphate kinase [Candidatus Altiarchaeota archaeon]|nr:isopentenyl phosphate kinase [Candidatus Altiarchaeota archaeon]